MTPTQQKMTEEDEMASAPESGQVPGGRDNPWDDDDEAPCDSHLFPTKPREPPGNDL